MPNPRRFTLPLAVAIILPASCSTSSPDASDDASDDASTEDGETGTTSSSDTSGKATDGGHDATSGDSGSGPQSTTSSNDEDSSTQTDGSTGGGELPPDPSQPGPSTWGESTYVLEAGDGTTIPLHLYIPDAPGPHPVVVLTHGFQLGPTNYASYGEHLASWDFVAVLPQMPGSLLSSPTHVELRDYLVDILDFIEAEGDDANGPLLGRADAGAMGLAGHSMGGKISLLTVTQDPRPLGVFGIDPVDAAGGPIAMDPADYPSVTPELMPAITIPLVLVGETTNASGGLGQACAPAEDNFHQYFLHAESPALEIEVLGANHMSFLDNPNCGLTCSVCTAGTDDPATTRQLTHGYMTAFFFLELRDDQAYRPYLTGRPIQAQADANLITFQTANGF